MNGSKLAGAFPWEIAEDNDDARAARALRAAAAAAATDERLRTRASSGVSGPASELGSGTGVEEHGAGEGPRDVVGEGVIGANPNPAPPKRVRARPIDPERRNSSGGR